MNLFQTHNSDSSLWLFDFDLTLYDFSEIQVLRSMDEPMNAFIRDSFDMSAEEANYLRQHFWKSYGTTLAGLRIEFDVKPDDFFDFIHNHEEILHPRENVELNDLLQRITAPKWIFTNGRRDWAEIGTTKIGVRHHFEKIIDLSDSDWLGKPHHPTYQMVQEQIPEGVNVIFLDDNYDNLMTAKNFGWKTVWMRPEEKGSGPFDFHFENLMQLDEFL